MLHSLFSTVRNRAHLGQSAALLLIFGFVPPVFGQTGTVVKRTIHSPSLVSNLVSEPVDRELNVYLPPSYAAEPKRKYPSIYLLHGYQAKYQQWMPTLGWNIRSVMDRLIAKGEVREMIIVMPDGRNRYGGSFYANSVTTGNWEDYITEDLISFIDGEYRTITAASARGVAGHSMGGYGAIRLAMKHPDRFGAVYALSPACLGWGGDLSLDNPAWDITTGFSRFNDLEHHRNDYLAQALLALAAAWSPDPAKPPFFADLPVSGRGAGRQHDPNVVARWSANMPVAMVDEYRSQLARLRGIAFDVGTKDDFSHIPLTCRQLSSALARNGIKHTFEEYDGDHNSQAAIRVGSKLLPFFSRVLDGPAETSKAP
jgi:S-formylglutathione hydrolase FrmB